MVSAVVTDDAIIDAPLTRSADDPAAGDDEKLETTTNSDAETGSDASAVGSIMLLLS